MGLAETLDGAAERLVSTPRRSVSVSYFPTDCVRDGMVRHDGLTVALLGGPTLRVEGAGVTVYCDPGHDAAAETADAGPSDSRAADGEREPKDGNIICVSHGHRYDPDAIRRVATDEAIVILFEGINTHRIDRDVDRPVDLPQEVRTVGSEADIVVGDAMEGRVDATGDPPGLRAGEVIVRTVSAHNEPDSPHVRPDGEVDHPEGRGCGFHLTVPSSWGKDVTVFYPGDTDVLDGHEQLDVSLFCPTFGGPSRMGATETARLTEAMDPDLVLPAQSADEQSVQDARTLAADIAEQGVPVVLDLQ